jgi:bifunctional non-homologous end joining protein LigD
MYAGSVQQLPEGDIWAYEIKFDGYRCLAGKDSTGVTLWSRRGNLFTKQFPNISQACEQLPLNTLIDGEVVAIDANGQISFNLLQHHRSQAQALVLYVFDLLVHRGRNLVRLPVPLEQRRDLLKDVFESTRAGPIALSEHIHAAPAELIRVVREFGFEGIIAKRKDSGYESGKRSGAWLKYKVNKCQEFVVGGYTRGDPFDALVVGCHEAGKLLYVSKVRAGFVPHVRKNVASRLKELETGSCPFANLPEGKRTQWALTKEQMKQCVWLRPQLVAQIEFTDWTPDGHLRETKFIGLRDDKDPGEVVRE